MLISQLNLVILVQPHDLPVHDMRLDLIVLVLIFNDTTTSCWHQILLHNFTLDIFRVTTCSLLDTIFNNFSFNFLYHNQLFLREDSQKNWDLLEIFIFSFSSQKLMSMPCFIYFNKNQVIFWENTCQYPVTGVGDGKESCLESLMNIF